MNLTLEELQEHLAYHISEIQNLFSFPISITVLGRDLEGNQRDFSISEDSREEILETIKRTLGTNRKKK